MLKIKAAQTGRGAANKDEQDCRGLANGVVLIRGWRFMIGANLRAVAGMVNGAIGVIKDIIWVAGTTNHLSSVPQVTMVKFNRINMRTPYLSDIDMADQD